MTYTLSHVNGIPAGTQVRTPGGRVGKLSGICRDGRWREPDADLGPEVRIDFPEGSDLHFAYVPVAAIGTDFSQAPDEDPAERSYEQQVALLKSLADILRGLNFPALANAVEAGVDGEELGPLAAEASAVIEALNHPKH